MTEKDAIAMLRALGYRVSKPKPRAVKKNRIGPTFVATFADGAVTRMSVWCMPDNLDYDRGVLLSNVAYESRARQRQNGTNAVLPPIVSARFEMDGRTLATYGKPRAGDVLVDWANMALAA
jgi:hypothetical protein